MNVLGTLPLGCSKSLHLSVAPADASPSKSNARLEPASTQLTQLQAGQGRAHSAQQQTGRPWQLGPQPSLPQQQQEHPQGDWALAPLLAALVQPLLGVLQAGQQQQQHAQQQHQHHEPQQVLPPLLMLPLQEQPQPLPPLQKQPQQAQPLLQQLSLLGPPQHRQHQQQREAQVLFQSMESPLQAAQAPPLQAAQVGPQQAAQLDQLAPQQAGQVQLPVKLAVQLLRLLEDLAPAAAERS